jgi:hypothetical protein
VAKDLIPPPSPAGRPPPDPGAEARADAELDSAATPAPGGAAPGPAPFRARFGFLWGALAGTGVCAVAVGVLLAATAGSGGPTLADHWSRWKPGTSRMVDGAADIAAHVGREYRLDSGDQLAAVSSGAIELGGMPLGVAVKPRGGQELEVLKGDGLLYVLSGLGPGGAVAGGKPTKARGRLLMREAIELSLYSFRYLDDVTMVAVMLPPPSGGKSSSADATQLRVIFYRPGDLLDRLQAPLTTTLSPRAPTPKRMSKDEAAKIDELALRNLFLAKIQPLESNLNYLVLTAPDKIG